MFGLSYLNKKAVFFWALFFAEQNDDDTLHCYNSFHWRLPEDIRKNYLNLNNLWEIV